MRRLFARLFLVPLFILGILSCAPKGNLLPEDYVSVEISYAKYLKIGKCEDFVLVEITNPWDTSKVLQRYVLTDSLQSLPEELPDAKVIKTPIDNIIASSSVHISILEKLGAVNKIAGVCEPDYILSEKVRQMVSDGEIADCGTSILPSIEKIIEAKGEVIISSTFENNNNPSAEKLAIPVIEAADYMENTPLGRTEWIKLYGYLLGLPEIADSIFREVESNYNSLKKVVDEALSNGKERPTMISEKKYGNSWGVPGGMSYISVMYEDAGAKNIFSDYPQTGSVMLSFEEVLSRGIDARYWLFKYNATGDYTYEQLLQEYPLYEKFGAFENRRIYGCNTSYLPYYDDITLKPDAILADFIKIFHPELLPEHTLKYFLPLK